MDYLWTFLGYQSNEVNMKPRDENRVAIDCFKREIDKLEAQRKLLHEKIERPIDFSNGNVRDQVLDIIRGYSEITNTLLDEMRFLCKIKKREDGPEELASISTKMTLIHEHANLIKDIVDSYKRML